MNTFTKLVGIYNEDLECSRATETACHLLSECEASLITRSWKLVQENEILKCSYRFWGFESANSRTELFTIETKLRGGGRRYQRLKCLCFQDSSSFNCFIFSHVCIFIIIIILLAYKVLVENERSNKISWSRL